MIYPELKKCVDEIRDLKGLTQEEIENVAAILLLTHFRYQLPDFKRKGWYISEIERDGKLRQEYFRRKKLKEKERVERFMHDKIMVK